MQHHLVPGVQEHHIISGQVRLSEVSRDFFHLKEHKPINCCTNLCLQPSLLLTYKNCPCFVGAAKQTWRLHHLLQGCGGLVLLFATKSRPEISCGVK